MTQLRSVLWLHDTLDFTYHRARMQCRYYWNVARRNLLCRRPRSILVYRSASVGDIVRATAITRTLRSRYPGATIDFLTSPGGCAVLKGNQDLNNILVQSDINSLGTYDWVINLQAAPPPTEFVEDVSDMTD